MGRFSFSSSITPFGLKLTEQQILDTYGINVSVEEKSKTLIKFGRHTSIGTSRETVWQQVGSVLSEDYQTSNTIDTVITGDAAFTGAVKIEGHTLDNGLLTFTVQTVNLNGRTPVTLPTPLARCTRIQYADGTAGLAANQTIYVCQSDTYTLGVPDTDSKVHCVLTHFYGQSQKAATAISNTDFWIVTGIYGSTTTFSGNNVVRLVDLELRTRKVGVINNPFATKLEISAGNRASSQAVLDLSSTPVIIPNNSDVELTMTATDPGVEVAAGIYGYLAKVI